MSLAPIVFFGFNRPDHTLRTLTALSNARLAADSILYIFLDGPKEGASPEMQNRINEVRSVAASKKWCGTVEISVSSSNKGLFRSIVSGVTDIIARHGKVIVLEDDVLVSPGFLEYMNDALDFYANEPRVMHISGYSRPDLSGAGIEDPTYFFFHTTCWGWATWKRAWDNFNPDPMAVMKKLRGNPKISLLNMDGTFEFYWGLKAISQRKFQSWNTIWHSVVFLNNGLSLHPKYSLVDNIGHDGSGTNCEAGELFRNEKLADKVPVTTIPLKLHEGARRKYNSLFRAGERLKFSLRHYIKYLWS